jgi:hypothetical protein
MYTLRRLPSRFEVGVGDFFDGDDEVAGRERLRSPALPRPDTDICMPSVAPAGISKVTVFFAIYAPFTAADSTFIDDNSALRHYK